MTNNRPVVVMTHNPKGKWGDVRPQIEKRGYYKNWNKSINVGVGQQVLLYVSNNVRQIQYLMEVTRVDEDTVDLKLVRKLSHDEMVSLSYEKLKENGLKQGTINYSLQNESNLSQYIFNILNASSKGSQIKESNKLRIKNIILYGSPGVGKTHNTNKLIALIEDGKSEQEIFETIQNNEQNDGVDTKDIKERVKFVTFHQSFGYEDFIEGFRPNEEGNIELEKGIFLNICKEAEENLLKSSEKIEVTFSDAFNTIFKEKIENQESIIFSLKRIGSSFKVYDYNDKTIYFEKQSGNTNHTLSISTLEKMYHTENNHFINGGLAVYYQPILDKLLEIKREAIVEKVERKNYYLIIDEINRGNISKIFGELITLIEEDKRDTLEVTLPYSKKLFKIPSNLYIIGTMNSTDKSIALIDIALRRRFTFLKMEPKLDLVDNIKAKNIMKQLNEKITETLGADYVLGHSYFMKIENDDDLEFVLEYKIKPLLEEYFYGDKNGYEQVIKMIEANQVDDNA